MKWRKIKMKNNRKIEIKRRHAHARCAASCGNARLPRHAISSRAAWRVRASPFPRRGMRAPRCAWHHRGKRRAACLAAARSAQALRRACARSAVRVGVSWRRSVWHRRGLQRKSSCCAALAWRGCAAAADVGASTRLAFIVALRLKSALRCGARPANAALALLATSRCARRAQRENQRRRDQEAAMGNDKRRKRKMA